MGNCKEEIGLRVKKRRKQLAMTQECLAEQLGISVKHLSEVERGLAGLSIENLIKLSNALKLSLDYIIKGEENKSLSTVLPIEDVPEDKRELLKELVNLGIKLTEQTP